MTPRTRAAGASGACNSRNRNDCGGENNEILVRGPNVFPGYWRRPEATAKAIEGGWFHTGDQGEKDANGNWRISGRLKNLIILNSGHNVAPEPLEDALARALPEAAQVVIVGNQRSFLAALVTAQPSNGLKAERVQAALDSGKSGLPHYKTIRAFHIVPEPLTIENGMLTANGKLKRDAIAAHSRPKSNGYSRKRRHEGFSRRHVVVECRGWRYRAGSRSRAVQ